MQGGRGEGGRGSTARQETELRRRRGLDAPRVVMAGVIDQGAHRVGNQRGLARLEQRRERAGLGQLGVEPALPYIALENERHAIVDRGDRRARGLGDDRARIDDLAVVSDPALPDPREREWSTVRTTNEKRLALGPPLALPLEEPVDDHQAAPPANGLAESRRRCDTFGSGQSQFVPDPRIVGPLRHEPPAQELNFGSGRTIRPAKDGDRIRRGHVVMRNEGGRLVQAERLAQVFRTGRECRSAAHGCSQRSARGHRRLAWSETHPGDTLGPPWRAVSSATSSRERPPRKSSSRTTTWSRSKTSAPSRPCTPWSSPRGTSSAFTTRLPTMRRRWGT